MKHSRGFTAILVIRKTFGSVWMQKCCISFSSIVVPGWQWLWWLNDHYLKSQKQENNKRCIVKLTQSLSLNNGKLNFNGLVDSSSTHLSSKLPGIIQWNTKFPKMDVKSAISRSVGSSLLFNSLKSTCKGALQTSLCFFD